MEDIFYVPNGELDPKILYEQVLKNFQITNLMLFKSFQNYKLIKHFPNYFSKLTLNNKANTAKKEISLALAKMLATSTQHYTNNFSKL